MNPKLKVITLISTLALSALTTSQTFAMGKSQPQMSAEERCQVILEILKNPQAENAKNFKFTKEEQLSCELAEARKQNEEARRRNEELSREAERRQTEEANAKKDLANLRGWFDLNDFKWNPSRCDADLKDSLDQGLATGRTQWTKKCLTAKQNEYLAKVGANDFSAKWKALSLKAQLDIVTQYGAQPGLSSRLRYPSFGVLANSKISNPLSYKAPTTESAQCNIPESPTYSVVAMCEEGCYTPDQRLQLKSGFVSLGEIASNVDAYEIVVVDPSSSLEDIRLTTRLIESVPTSIQEGLNEIIDVETVSGKRLSVTTNHPLLLASGVMVRADTLKVGDQLLAASGSPEAIQSILGRSYFGKVYNVYVNSNDLFENIVVAEGLLSGSALYQNEGVRELNRKLFRLNLPAKL